MTPWKIQHWFCYICTFHIVRVWVGFFYFPVIFHNQWGEQLKNTPYVEFRDGDLQETRHTQICPNDQPMNTYLGVISTVEDIVSQMMK